MPILLAQGNTILATSKDRQMMKRYLVHRYPKSDITMVRDPDKKHVMKVYVSSPLQGVRMFDMYHARGWRLFRDGKEIGKIND